MSVGSQSQNAECDASLRPWCKNARCVLPGGKPGLAGNKGFPGKWDQVFSLMIVARQLMHWKQYCEKLCSFPWETVSNIIKYQHHNIYQLFLHFCSFWFHIQPHRSLPIDPPVREPRTRGVDATGRETHLQGGTGRIWSCTVWSCMISMWRGS